MELIEGDGEDDVYLVDFYFFLNTDSSVVCHISDFRSKALFEIAKRLSRSFLTH